MLKHRELVPKAPPAFGLNYPALNFVASAKLFNALLLEEEIGAAGVQVSELQETR